MIVIGVAIAQATPRVIEHKAEIKKNIKTCFRQCLVFKLWHFEKGHPNFYFLEDKSKLQHLKLTTFFVSTARDNYTKLSRLAVRSRMTFLIILLTSVVVCKQRLLHGNIITQYFQNCKYYGIYRDHFGKNLCTCTKFMKNNDHKTAYGRFFIPYNFQRPFFFYKVHLNA